MENYSLLSLQIAKDSQPLYMKYTFFVPLRRFSAKNFGRPNQYAEIFITVILNVKIDIVSIFRVSMTSNKKVIDL